ncbi:MAG: hypothetical protein AAFZ65_20685, partial [Planctomycetota bacterium]
MSTASTLTLLTPFALGLLLHMAPPSKPATPPADPADVASVDAILKAVYESISGPAGQPRQWDRFRSLMHPDGARLMATQELEDGSERLVVMTPDT